MKKTLILVGLAILVTISVKPTKLVALDKEIDVVETNTIQKPIVKLTNREYVEKLVDKYSKKYSVSKSSMMKTIDNENHTFVFDRQSDCLYKKGNRWGFPSGTREKSYGLAMIHLPDHPDITYEQAIDPDFAIEFMAKEFSKGHQNQWMGYEA